VQLKWELERLKQVRARLAAKQGTLHSAAQRLKNVAVRAEAVASAQVEARLHPVEAPPCPDAEDKEMEKEQNESRDELNEQKRVSKQAARIAKQMSAEALEDTHTQRRAKETASQAAQAEELANAATSVYAVASRNMHSSSAALASLASDSYARSKRILQVAEVAEKRKEARLHPPTPPPTVSKELSMQVREEVAALVNASSDVQQMISSPDHGLAGSAGSAAVRLAARVEHLAKILKIKGETSHQTTVGEDLKAAEIAVPDSPPDTSIDITSTTVSTLPPEAATPATAASVEATADEGSKGDMNESSPDYTTGDAETPKGTKDMGGWAMRVYTPEQQARLHVNEQGEPVGAPSPLPATPAVTPEDATGDPQERAGADAADADAKWAEASRALLDGDQQAPARHTAAMPVAPARSDVGAQQEPSMYGPFAPSYRWRSTSSSGAEFAIPPDNLPMEPGSSSAAQPSQLDAELQAVLDTQPPEAASSQPPEHAASSQPVAGPLVPRSQPAVLEEVPRASIQQGLEEVPRQEAQLVAAHRAPVAPKQAHIDDGASLALRLLRLGDAKMSTDQPSRHLHRFPSHISCYEVLTLPTVSRHAAAVDVARRLEDMFTALRGHALHVEALHAGVDTRFVFSLGTGVGDIDAKKVRQELGALAKEALVKPEEAENLQLLLQAAAHGDRDAWAGLQQASELLSAVVWSHREVAAGVKHLSGDHTLTLADAIGQHAPLRVQLLGAFGGRLHSLEATFEVQYGQGRHLTASAAEYKAALLKSAKMEVAEHQPMLAAQRLWSLAVITQDDKLRNQLAPTLSSDTAALSQIEADATKAILALQRKAALPYDTIAGEVHWMRKLLKVHAQGSDLARELRSPLNEVLAACDQYKTNAVFDTAQVQKAFGKVRQALRPMVARQAQMLLDSLPLGAALEEAEVALLPRDKSTTEDLAELSQAASADAPEVHMNNKLPKPKVVSAELPEEHWN